MYCSDINHKVGCYYLCQVALIVMPTLQLFQLQGHNYLCMEFKIDVTVVKAAIDLTVLEINQNVCESICNI